MKKKLQRIMMNKSVLKHLVFATFAVCSLGLSAQKGKVLSAESSVGSGRPDDLLEAKSYIDEATVHENTANWYRTWLVRAQVYTAINERKNVEFLQDLSLGSGYQAAYAAQRFWKSEGIKSMDLEAGAEVTGRAFIAGLNEAQDIITNKLYDSAVRYYQILVFIFDRMDTAQSNFLNRQGISKKTVVESMARVAVNASNEMLKKEVLNELVDDGSKSHVVFEALSMVYLNSGDTAGAEAVIRKGIARVPDDQDMFQLLINHFVGINQVDKLFTDVNKQLAITETARLYEVRGKLYESREMYDSAMRDYAKALTLDEFNYDAHLNLGVGLLKFESKKLYDRKIAATNATERAAIDKELKELFEKAKQHLEIASENKNYTVEDQINIYKALKAVALELGDKSGAEMHEEKIQALKAQLPTPQ